MTARGFDLGAIASGLAFGPSQHELARLLAEQPSRPVVIQAPPGSGKTTIVPPVVANALAAQGLGGRIVVTQPRRVAARAAARRLAQLDGSALGGRVGFSVRGESKVSAETRVEFATAGLMLRRLLAEPDLEGIGAVVIDEVHERSIDTDLLLAMVNQVAQLREDLCLVVMSATLHAAELSALLAREEPAPVLSAHSAQHPVAEEFDGFTGRRTTEHGLSEEYQAFVADRALAHARAANDAAAEPVDTLVFLPGVREVQRVCTRLQAAGATALALHAQVSAREQDAILGQPPAGTPARIIVSTALAESSVTVPRVRLVIDAGYARAPRRDTGRGISGLVTVVASRAAAAQRAGRAGRLGPGRVVRTLDEKSFAAAPAHTAPEIRTGDLVNAGLQLAAWGTPRGQGLALWEAPPAALMDADEAVLRALGAVDEQGRITALGERMAAIPTDPRTARALLQGTEHYGAAATAQVIALLAGTERAPDADLAALLAALRRPAHPGHRDWSREVRRLARLAGAPHGTAQDAATASAGSAALAGVCALAFPQWIGRRVAQDEYLLASGTRARLPRGSTLGHCEFLAVAEVSRSGHNAVIRRATGIELQEVLRLLPGEHRIEHTATLAEGRLSARRVESFGAIELSSHPVKPTADLGLQAAQSALREQRLALFGSQPEFEALRRRLAVAHRLLGAPFPTMDEAALLEHAEDWLAPALRQLAEGRSASRIELLPCLRTLLPWEHAHDFDALVPERLQVPSGSKISIEYPEPGDQGPAVVAVKLQECFGLDSSPRLVRGLLPVQFHLLSPAGRPLAVTEDLASFFNGPYAQVRAEMRGRYPKHPWPENPWEHVATAATTRRLRREQ